jgi:hypothetical protein
MNVVHHIGLNPRTLLFALSLTLCCCTTQQTAEQETETEAHRQTELARSLESAGDMREAAHEYSIVAEHYPGTTFQALAARRAGLLYADPGNAARNDSLALYWLRVYAQLPISAAEREETETCIKLVEYNTVIRLEIERLAGVQDSLGSVLRRQISGSAALNKRVGDLEAEVEEATRELRKLKEIDARAPNRRKSAR